MVIIGKWNQQDVTLSSKSNCITVSLQSRVSVSVYSYDLHGRLWTAMRNGVSYRRGLDGKIVAKWGSIAYEHERRWLAPEEARQLEEDARSIIAALYQDILIGNASFSIDLPGETLSTLNTASRFDPSAIRADIDGYHQVYKPVGILPPDQYMAVVLQLTEGCSFNTCTFCTFYRDRPFQIKTAEAFREHIQKVVDYLGEGMSLRRTIFLGDANSLVVPVNRLVELVEIIHEYLDVQKMGGIYAFLDGFSGEKKSVADFIRLRELGLKRVYVGMESGNAELLQFLHKPGKPADGIQAVRTMKAAGISVGVIALLGAGGHRFDQQHVRDTIDAINQMELDADDIIYFSELVETEGMDYTRDAYQNQLIPLTTEERRQQCTQIEQGLVFDVIKGTPHVSRYDIREFVY